MKWWWRNCICHCFQPLLSMTATFRKFSSQCRNCKHLRGTWFLRAEVKVVMFQPLVTANSALCIEMGTQQCACVCITSRVGVEDVACTLAETASNSSLAWLLTALSCPCHPEFCTTRAEIISSGNQLHKCNCVFHLQPLMWVAGNCRTFANFFFLLISPVQRRRYKQFISQTCREVEVVLCN